MKVDESIDKYKAILIVKDYKKKEGMDYFDTYSPITRIICIRLLIVIVALNNLEITKWMLKLLF